MPISRISLGALALCLAACPPPPVPGEDATTPSDVPDAEVAEPLGFGACATALDCATYPNAASVCDHEECALMCIPGFANCDRELNNGCEQSLSTAAHCAGCDAPCAPPNAFGTCANQVCTVAACNLGFGDCDGALHNGCETLLVTPTDCGGCGVPCAPPNAEPTCDAGECGVLSCEPGFGDCDDDGDNGCEVTVDNRLRCGACDVLCAPGQGCAASDDDGYRCSPGLGEPVGLPAPSTAVVVGSDGVITTAATLSEDTPWGEETLAVAGPTDGVLIRHGEEGWVKVIGGLNADTIDALGVDVNDNLYVTGTFQSGAKLGGGLLPHTGGTDVFVASYDAQGELRWGLGVGGLGEDAPTALAVGGGAVVVVGTAEPPASFGGDTLTGGHVGGAVGFVALYSSSGTPAWSAAVIGADSAIVDVAMGSDGAVHALATASGAMEIDGDPVTESGPAMLTWSVDGSFTGAQPLDLVTVTAMTITPDGRALVAGVEAGGDAVILVLDPEGPWTIAVQGITDLAAGAHGGVVAVGHTTGAFDVGLGPVVVDGVLAARYDLETGEADWFLGLDDVSPAPRVAVAGASVAVAGAELTPLTE